MMSCGAEGKSLRTPPRAQKLKKHFWNWLRWRGYICRAAATLSCLHSGLFFFFIYFFYFFFFSPGWKKNEHRADDWKSESDMTCKVNDILRDWGKVKTFFSFYFPFSVVDDGELMSVYSSSGFMRATIEKNTWQLLPRVRYVCVLTQKTPPPKKENLKWARELQQPKKSDEFSPVDRQHKKKWRQNLIIIINSNKTKQNKTKLECEGKFARMARYRLALCTSGV
jgi:hypothetical protein